VDGKKIYVTFTAPNLQGGLLELPAFGQPGDNQN